MRVHGHRSPLIEEEMPGSLLKLIHISSEEHMSFHKYVDGGRAIHRMHTEGNNTAEIPQSGPRRCGLNPSGQAYYTETSQFIRKSGLKNSCSSVVYYLGGHESQEIKYKAMWGKRY